MATDIFEEERRRRQEQNDALIRALEGDAARMQAELSSGAEARGTSRALQDTLLIPQATALGGASRAREAGAIAMDRLASQESAFKQRMAGIEASGAAAATIAREMRGLQEQIRQASLESGRAGIAASAARGRGGRGGGGGGRGGAAAETRKLSEWEALALGRLGLSPEELLKMGVDPISVLGTAEAGQFAQSQAAGAQEERTVGVRGRYKELISEFPNLRHAQRISLLKEEGAGKGEIDALRRWLKAARPLKGGKAKGVRKPLLSQFIESIRGKRTWSGK